MKSNTKNRRMLSSLTLAACSMISACAVTTRYVVVDVGRPVQILENVRVTARQLADDGQTVTQSIGGWIAMPPDHWAVVKAALEKKP